MMQVEQVTGQIKANKDTVSDKVTAHRKNVLHIEWYIPQQIIGAFSKPHTSIFLKQGEQKDTSSICIFIV